MKKSEVYRTISLSDLFQAGISLRVSSVDGVLKVVGGFWDNKPIHLKQLPDILYKLGISKNGRFEVMPKTLHRKLDGKVVDDYRLVGRERIDRVWITSGFASEEAKIASSKMRDMDEQVRRLQNGGDRC